MSRLNKVGLCVVIFSAPALVIAQEVSGSDLNFAQEFMALEFPNGEENPELSQDKKGSVKLLAQIKYHPDFVFGIKNAWDVAEREGIEIPASRDEGFTEYVNQHGGLATLELAREYAVGLLPNPYLEGLELQEARNRYALGFLLPFYDKQEIDEQARLLRNDHRSPLRRMARRVVITSGDDDDIDFQVQTISSANIIDTYLKAKAVNKFQKEAVKIFESNPAHMCGIEFCDESGITIVFSSPWNYDASVASTINPRTPDLANLHEIADLRNRK